VVDSDEREILAVLESCHRWAYRISRRGGSGHADAEDFAQSAALRVHRFLSKDGRQQFDTQELNRYCHKIVVNEWVSEIRRARSRRAREGLMYSSVNDLADRRSPDREGLSVLRECMEKLPPEDRAIAEGRFLGEMTLEELGRQKARSKAWVHLKLRQIQARLRTCMGLAPEG